MPTRKFKLATLQTAADVLRLTLTEFAEAQTQFYKLNPDPQRLAEKVQQAEDQQHRNKLYKIAYNATNSAPLTNLMLADDKCLMLLESILAALQRKDFAHSRAMRSELLQACKKLHATE